MEELDEALLTRMDYKLYIGPPKKNEREKIIQAYIKDLFKNDVESADLLNSLLENIVENTEGFTGRTIFKLLNFINIIKSTTDNNKTHKENSSLK